MKTGICALMALSVVVTAAPEPQAVEIARGMMQAMGGEAAWKQARYVRFDFIVKIRGQARVARAHLWDKQTGRYRLEDKAANEQFAVVRSEEHTSELQSLRHLVCRLLLE